MAGFVRAEGADFSPFGSNAFSNPTKRTGARESLAQRLASKQAEDETKDAFDHAKKLQQLSFKTEETTLGIAKKKQDEAIKKQEEAMKKAQAQQQRKNLFTSIGSLVGGAVGGPWGAAAGGFAGGLFG